LALGAGRQHIEFRNLLSDPLTRTLFFRLRLPRVLLGALIGASLSLAGAALQALFRNPLADPFTLGVSGGGALGGSVAIALGWSARFLGIPAIYLAAFGGAILSVLLVKTIAKSGAIIVPGALLLAGVVVNLVSSAAVIAVQYIVDPASALRILRWIVGSLDAVGIEPVRLMFFLLAPGWAGLLFFSSQLQLLSIDQDTAATLGVNVARCETAVHVFCSFVVGITVAAGGAIGFVGLVVPHAVRILFGEDLRIVMPGSLLLGAAFLVLTDALARTVLPSGELPVGAVTGLLGGPLFLWLLHRRLRYSVW
jgi:iron complex transport system permease protein